MEITEEQRRQIEANRLAALEKRRKRLAEASAAAAAEWRLAKCPRIDAAGGTGAFPAPCTTATEWTLSKCQRIAPHPRPPLHPLPLPPPTPPRPPVGFQVVLEVCSPDEFSVAVGPVEGATYPGEAECLGTVQDCLASASVCFGVYYDFDFDELLQKFGAFLNTTKIFFAGLVVQFSATQSESQSGHLRPVFKLVDYEEVFKCLKVLPGAVVQGIPYSTRNVIQNLATKSSQTWASDEDIDDRLKKLPLQLKDALLPFQLEGVRFGLKRHGRCLIADGWGLICSFDSVTIAALYLISHMSTFFYWLNLPVAIFLFSVFGHQDRLEKLGATPKAVIISYNMLTRLQESMVKRSWAVMIIDESHNIRCTKTPEKHETTAVLKLAPGIKHIILLSGTPSLSRPFDIYHQINILWPCLLGNNKFDYAKKYCSPHVRSYQGRTYQDFSKGTRLTELNVLLSQTVMMLFARNLQSISLHKKLVFLSENGIKFVRIDGSTLQRDRKEAVDSFRVDPEVKVAIIGITAGGVGLDFSTAQNVVFVELPKSASELLQAEDRAHRRGQTNAVNIYIFCAKNSLDESHWLKLNQSLFRVSSLMNGKKDAIREIEVSQIQSNCLLTNKSLSSTSYHLSQVSQHTGRVHLYSCVPGHDSRPKPLLENFLPEELEPPSSLSNHIKKTRTQLLKRNPAFRKVFNAFIKEWSALRPIDQKKLLGKPLQLPLSLELCFLKDSIHHSTDEYRFRTSGRALRQNVVSVPSASLIVASLSNTLNPYLRKEKRNTSERSLQTLQKERNWECTLENMRTLCVACHYEVTKAQHKELKELRRKEKEHLKNVLNQLKDKASEVTEELDNNLLLVSVPGSAYSVGVEVPDSALRVEAE
ncbi:hypothetical protein PR202_gb21522 [Eleusine coracana subsp. coracana]|uniref:Uncharacterized protein n=1 Tax=Eleusine coracana subsp. coracana TaxID=191504 RepID=A0AAV5FFE4_ELECO|nr:hypothetical protein PR202_gb21522 [Eleusine coracana subsp. coracana]